MRSSRNNWLQRLSGLEKAIIAIGAIAILGTLTFFWFGNSHAYTSKTVIPGVGIGNVLQVQVTTLGQIESLMGRDYRERETEGVLSEGIGQSRYFKDIYLGYDSVGLAFQFRAFADETIPKQNLKLRGIFISCVRGWFGCAFTGKTDKGVGLGSSRGDVHTAYGETDRSIGQSGIIAKRQGINFSFDPQKYDAKDLVSRIVIYHPSDFENFS
jgi:hypothetical protein